MSQESLTGLVPGEVMKLHKYKSALKYFLVIFVVVLLSGCKTELYSKLSEQEGNEMLALLLTEGVSAEKETDKKGLVSILVDENEIAVSVEVLTNHGYPKNKFQTFGDIYKQEGLVFSPLQEKARYIYALSQEISGTLAKIDGVLVARVHVVLAEETHPGQIGIPASASVFVKHVPDVSLDHMIPSIKSIVTNAIEGLSYEKVSVSLFPAAEQALERNLLPQQVLFFLNVSKESVTSLYVLFGTMLLLILLLAASTWFMLVNFGGEAKTLLSKKLRFGSRTPEENADTDQGGDAGETASKVAPDSGKN